MECYDMAMALAEMAAHAVDTITVGDLWIITWDTGITNVFKWMPDIQALCYVEGSDT